MEFNLDKIVKAPFEEKDWIKRLLPIFLVNLLYMFVSQASNLFQNLIVYSTPFTSTKGYNYFNATGFNSEAIGTSLVVSCIVFIFALAYMAFQILYTMGFNLVIAKNVMNDEKPTLPEPNRFKDFAKFGGKYFVTGLVYAILFGCLTFAGVVIIALVGSALRGEEARTLTTILAIGGISILGILGLIYGIFVQPATTYLLIKTGSLAQALNPSTVFAVIKAGAKEFLILLAFNIALAVVMMGISLMSILTCCLIVIISPIITTLFSVYMHYLMGLVFKELKSKGI